MKHECGIGKNRRSCQSVAQRESCTLYDLEIVGAGKNRILRVFIDKEGEQGVSIADCSNVSRALDLLLDVEDLMPGAGYQLEVSSPGLERKLRLAWHFEKALGEMIEVHLLESVGEFIADESSSIGQEDKRKRLKGTVGAVVDEKVKLIVFEKNERCEVDIPLNQIKKAKIVFDFNKISGAKKIKN